MPASPIFTDWKFTHADTLWGRQPIQLQHRLSRHPLFSMPNLAALIDRYPEDRYTLVCMGVFRL